jgi:hypothetical protein
MCCGFRRCVSHGEDTMAAVFSPSSCLTNQQGKHPSSDTALPLLFLGCKELNEGSPCAFLVRLAMSSQDASSENNRNSHSENNNNNNNNSHKNATHLEALLGTWTVWTDLKASIGNYHINAYMVVHLVADPAQHWSCHKVGCSELHNNICQWHSSSNHNDNAIDSAASTIVTQDGPRPNVWTPSCGKMTDTVSTWSDTVAFIQAGFHFQAGAPFYTSHNWTTGTEWSGPYHVVWAHEDDPMHPTVDRYYSRYVQTAATPLLSRRPSDESLWGSTEFQASLGPAAVQTTLARQAHWNWTAPHGNARPDPFEPYRNTCAAGNLAPTLPMYRVEFDNDRLRVQVDASLLLAPSIQSKAYKLMPWMAKQINSHVHGFAVRGPYCWQDDSKRGYVDKPIGVSRLSPTRACSHTLTHSLSCSSAMDGNNSWLIDVSMDEWMPFNGTDTAVPASAPLSSDLHMTRGCVQGLPCVPPLLLHASSNGGTATTVVLHDNATATSIWLLLFVGILLGLFLDRCWKCCYLWICRPCRWWSRRHPSELQRPLLPVEDSSVDMANRDVVTVTDPLDETGLGEVDDLGEEGEEDSPAPISTASTASTASV